MKCQTHRAGSTNPQKLQMREEQRALQADWRWKNLSAAAAKGLPVVLVHHSTSTASTSTSGTRAGTTGAAAAGSPLSQ
jgi:hypothetical protein